MARKHQPVEIGFETTICQLNTGDLLPLKTVSVAIKNSPKYAQIAASIREVGLIEPPVVCRDRSEPGKYLLLDGHLRIEVLKDCGETTVMCLISADDEAFTYNKRVNRVAIIQEHRMILKAIEQGVAEQRLAKALNLDLPSIKRRVHLLDGICSEAAEILKDKLVAMYSLLELKKLCPLRQIEAAELMVAMNRYTIGYVKSLVAATPETQLAEEYRPKKVKGLADEQISLMERESENLEREFRIAEQSYGADHLDLVLTIGYLRKLLTNVKVVRYLVHHHHGIFVEFQKLSEIEATAA